MPFFEMAVLAQEEIRDNQMVSQQVNGLVADVRWP